MKQIAFKMKLNPGQGEEYKRRHDAIWPELVKILKQTGIQDYSIFLDEETHILFATMKIEVPEMLNTLPLHPVMRKWWDSMKDMMLTNPDHSPVSNSLEEVFHLA